MKPLSPLTIYSLALFFAAASCNPGDSREKREKKAEIRSIVTEKHACEENIEIEKHLIDSLKTEISGHLQLGNEIEDSATIYARQHVWAYAYILKMDKDPLSILVEIDSANKQQLNLIALTYTLLYLYGKDKQGYIDTVRQTFFDFDRRKNSIAIKCNAMQTTLDENQAQLILNNRRKDDLADEEKTCRRQLRALDN